MKRLLLASCTSVALALGSFSPAHAEPQVSESTAEGPAMWKVADEDTTIYLFGTVHLLPKDVEWFSGDIENALASADTLVTEIVDTDLNDPAMQQKTMALGLYTDGTSLRSVMDNEERATYEAALGSLGLPPGAFDQFEPWLAGLTLSVLPLMQAGYQAESGVEKVIEAKFGPDRTREGLETVDYQLGVFDGLPEDTQLEFLISSAEYSQKLVPMMNEMVGEWLDGDADGLAVLMNEGLKDEALAEALLYQRNRNWVDWIDTRLDTPGTVFVAVGAGHLAGKGSVQDYLTQRGITVTRVR